MHSCFVIWNTGSGCSYYVGHSTPVPFQRKKLTPGLLRILLRLLNCSVKKLISDALTILMIMINCSRIRFLQSSSWSPLVDRNWSTEYWCGASAIPSVLRRLICIKYLATLEKIIEVKLPTASLFFSFVHNFVKDIWVQCRWWRKLKKNIRRRLLFMLRVLTCLAGSGKRVSWFRYLSFISLFLHQLKSSALLAGLSPGEQPAQESTPSGFKQKP